MCSGEPGDDVPLTNEEIEQLPEPLRGILIDIGENSSARDRWDDERDAFDW